MGIARDIARLKPNSSGLLPNANIEAVAASKLTGQVALATQVSGTLPDANAPSGSVVQVVRSTITTQASYSLNAAAIQATALTASITPSSASNHILIQIMASIQGTSAGQGLYGEIRRGTSTVLNTTAGGGSNNYPIHWMNIYNLPNMSQQLASQTWLGFDSPGTTSSTSYTFYVYGVAGTTNVDLNSQGTGRGSSVILLWEIAA